MKKCCFLFFYFLLDLSISNAHEIKEDCCECAEEAALDALEDAVSQIKAEYSSILQEQEENISIRLSMQAQGPHAIENYKYLKFRNNLTGEIITPDFDYINGRINITDTHLISASQKVSFNYILEIPGKESFEELCFSLAHPTGLFSAVNSKANILQSIRFSVIDMPDRSNAPIKVTIFGFKYASKDVKTLPFKQIDGFKLSDYTGALYDEILIIEATENYPYSSLVDTRPLHYIHADDNASQSVDDLKFLRICEYIRLARSKYLEFNFNNKVNQTILLNVFREYGWINASDFGFIKEQLGWD